MKLNQILNMLFIRVHLHLRKHGKYFLHHPKSEATLSFPFRSGPLNTTANKSSIKTNYFNEEIKEAKNCNAWSRPKLTFPPLGLSQFLNLRTARFQRVIALDEVATPWGVLGGMAAGAVLWLLIVDSDDLFHLISPMKKYFAVVT